MEANGKNFLGDLVESVSKIKLIDQKLDILLKNTNLDDYILRDELQEKMKLGRSTVHKYINLGVIKDYKLGGKHYVKRSEILAALEKSA